MAIKSVCVGTRIWSLVPSLRFCHVSEVRIEQSASPVTGRVTLSITTTGSPCIRTESSRFSSSSSVAPCDITGASRPVPSAATTSAISDLPVAIVGAVNPCKGAVRIDLRQTTVNIADRATDRDGMSTKGKPSRSSFSRPRAATASARVGLSGTAPKVAPPVFRIRPEAGSYPSTDSTDPSGRSVGHSITPFNTGSRQKPSRAA